jgi:hypothetical protein
MSKKGKHIFSWKMIEKIIFLVIWVIIYFIPVFRFQGYGNSSDWQEVYTSWINISVFLFIFLINLYVLIPRYLIKKLHVDYVLAIIVISSLLVCGGNAVSESYNKKVITAMPPMEIGPGLAPMEFSEDMPPPEPYKQLMKAENQENDLSFLLNLAIALLVTGTGTAYKVIFLWITEEKRRKTLEDNIQTPGLPEEENIFVKSDYKTVKIKINDILYVESANEYIKIYLEDGDSVTTFMRLKNFETMLPQNRFMRVQRSFIINLSKIKAVEKNRIFIDSKRFVPIGEQYKEAFQQFLGKNFFQ